METIQQTIDFLVTKLKESELEKERLKNEINEIASVLRVLLGYPQQEPSEKERNKNIGQPNDEEFDSIVRQFLQKIESHKIGSKERIIAVIELFEFLNQYEHIRELLQRRKQLSKVILDKLKEFESGPCSLPTKLNQLKQETKTTSEVSDELDLLCIRFENVKNEIRSKIET
jgi:hypothetical protein